MQYQAPAKSPVSLLVFFVYAVLLLMLSVALLALPAAAQEEGPPAGTPAQGSNPNSPNSPPDLVTIAAEDCTVEGGASVTLEDGDGTQARFVDGQLGIEISSTSRQITVEGPNDDFIGDHAVSESDPGFDTDGDYAVVTTTGIACQSGGTTGTPRDTNMDTTTAANDQYDATTGDGADQETVTLCHRGTEITVDVSAKQTHLAHGDSVGRCDQSGIPDHKKIIDIPKKKVLINTGGPPLMLLGAALMCLAGAGIAVQLLRVLHR